MEKHILLAMTITMHWHIFHNEKMELLYSQQSTLFKSHVRSDWFGCVCQWILAIGVPSNTKKKKTEGFTVCMHASFPYQKLYLLMQIYTVRYIFFGICESF